MRLICFVCHCYGYCESFRHLRLSCVINSFENYIMAYKFHFYYYYYLIYNVISLMVFCINYWAFGCWWIEWMRYFYFIGRNEKKTGNKHKHVSKFRILPIKRCQISRFKYFFSEYLQFIHLCASLNFTLTCNQSMQQQKW